MDQEKVLKILQKKWHGTLKSYLIGFFGSLILTSISFFLVIEKFIPTPLLIYFLIFLALFQAVIQLLFFLHLKGEAKPHLMTLTFLFTVLILLIIVLGSFWIMYDLNDRMMPEMNMSEGMKKLSN